VKIAERLALKRRPGFRWNPAGFTFFRIGDTWEAQALQRGREGLLRFLSFDSPAIEIVASSLDTLVELVS